MILFIIMYMMCSIDKYHIIRVHTCVLIYKYYICTDFAEDTCSITYITLYIWVLYCIILYCIILYCVILYCIILYCFILLLYYIFTEVVEHACSITSLCLGETLPNVAKDMDIHSYREPLGVTAGICPFNFPAMIPLWVCILTI